MTQHWNNPEDIKRILNKLVNVPSVSGSVGEVMMSGKIHEIIEEIPYFQQHPDSVIDCPIENDSFSRSSVRHSIH